MCTAGHPERAPAVLRQLPVAARLLLCEDERCLRPINLSLVGADLCLLDSDLRVDVLHARGRPASRRSHSDSFSA